MRFFSDFLYPVATLLCVVSAVPLAQPDATIEERAGPTPVTNASVQTTLLSLHNAWRAHHGTPPLVWNSTLEKAAQESAMKCAMALTKNNPYGENLAGGAYRNPAYYAYLWYQQESNYNYTQPAYSSQVGGFTQVVWKASTQLGCSYVTGCPGTFPNLLFCEYGKRGNILPASNFAANVLRPQKSPPNPPPPSPNA